MEKIDSRVVSKKGRRVDFPNLHDYPLEGTENLHCTTFLKKPGYAENFADCMVFLPEPLKSIVYDAPGGPSRVLYLSTINSGKSKAKIDFIVANGEKITEWAHWLPVIRYARTQDGDRALRLFEVTIERPWTKDGVLMSTSHLYSIFVRDSAGNYVLDLSRLNHFERPSQYRGVLVVTSRDNLAVVNAMLRHGYREICFI